MDSSLKTALEGSLAASAGVDLGFDHKFSTEADGHIFCLLGSVGYGSWLGGNAKFCKKFAGLKFVNIHVVRWRSLHAPSPEEKNSFNRE